MVLKYPFPFSSDADRAPQLKARVSWLRGKSDMNPWPDLQKWFASNCDGEWEHDFGIKIETMSDPGWLVIIDLEETNLEGKLFTPIKKGPSEASWIDCRVEESKFRGMSDATKLEEILRVFIHWARSQNEDWLRPPDP